MIHKAIVSKGVRIIWFTLFSALTAHAAPKEPPVAAPVALQFENGLRAVLQDTPNAQSVVAVSRFNHGWSDDPADLSGATHLLEHVWFRSLTASGLDLWNTLRARGCEISAITGPRFTQFVTTCPATELDFVLDQSLRQMTNPLNGVTEQHVAVEMAIVAHESSDKNNAETDLGREIYAKLQPPESPVHARLASDARTTSGVTLDTLRSQAPIAFSPSIATLVIAGPIQVDAVRATLTERLGSSTPLQALDEGATAYTGVRSDAHDSAIGAYSLRIPLPRLVLAWNLDPALGESSAMDVFASALGSTLGETLSEEDVIYGLGCSVLEDPTHPALVCSITLAPGATRAEVLPLVDESLRVAVTGSGLAAIRQQVALRRTQLPQTVTRGLANPEHNALRIASEVASTGTLRSTEDVVNAVRKWNPTRLLKVAQSWFTLDNAAKLWVVPGAPDAEPNPTPPGPPPIEPQTPQLASSPAQVLADAPAAQRRLESGLTIVATQRVRSPTVLASVRVPGGTGQVPFPLAVFSERWSAAPEVRETREITSGEILRADSAEVWALGPANQASRTLNTALAAAALRVPLFSDDFRDHIDRWAEVREASQRAVEGRPETVADQLLWTHVTPNHRPSAGLNIDDLATLKKASPVSVSAHLFQQYTPQHAVLVISGPQPPSELLDLASRRFENWRTPVGVSSLRPTPTRPADAPTPARFVLVDPSLPQSTLRWQCRLPNALDQGARRVVNQLVDDQMWRRLREEAGLTYTPWSGISSWPDGTTVLEIGLHTGASDIHSAWSILDAATQALPQVASAHLDPYRDRVRRHLHLEATSTEGTEALVFATHAEGGDPTHPLAHLNERLDALDGAALARALTACVTQGTTVIYGPTDPGIPGFETRAISMPGGAE